MCGNYEDIFVFGFLGVIKHYSHESGVVEKFILEWAQIFQTLSWVYYCFRFFVGVRNANKSVEPTAIF